MRGSEGGMIAFVTMSGGLFIPDSSVVCPRVPDKVAAAVREDTLGPPPLFANCAYDYARKAAQCFDFSVRRRAAGFLEV
jgi:hypothetical protein